MEVIVTGGRDYDDRGFVFTTLSEIKPTLVIEGGARGADRFAREWAIENNVPYKTVDADWTKYGRMAGHLRNKKMLDSYPNATVVAFPGGRGTSNCVAQAELRRRTIVRASK